MKATKTTDRMPVTEYRDVERITVTMTAEEATAIAVMLGKDSAFAAQGRLRDNGLPIREDVIVALADAHYALFTALYNALGEQAYDHAAGFRK